MRYVLMDWKNGDLFDEEFDTAEAALEKGEEEWSRLTEYDKKLRSAFYVMETEYDADCEKAHDGTVVKRWK